MEAAIYLPVPMCNLQFSEFTMHENHLFVVGYANANIVIMHPDNHGYSYKLPVALITDSINSASTIWVENYIGETIYL